MIKSRTKSTRASLSVEHGIPNNSLLAVLYLDMSDEFTNPRNVLEISKL